MRRIKLMADYHCWPLWTVDTETDGFGDVDPDTLPISDLLKQDLMAWAQQLDAALDWNDPAGTVWPAGFWTRFNARGAALAERLRAELGPEVEVLTHFWGDGGAKRRSRLRRAARIGLS